MREDRKRLYAIGGQVRLYIEHLLPKYERTGTVPDLPFDRKAKGESNSPIGEHVLLLMHVNRDAFRKLSPVLEELERHRVAYGGHGFRDMLALARYDSGAFRRLLAADEGYSRAFWEMCLLVARAVMAKHDKKDADGNVVVPAELVVVPNPGPHADGGVVLGPQAQPDIVPDPNAVRPNFRTITARDAYRWIVSLLESVRSENPGITEAAAEVEVSKELERLGHNGSIGRIRDAKTFVNKERAGEVA